MADGPLTREEIEELLVALIKEGIPAPADRSKLEGEAGDCFPNELRAMHMS